MIIIMIVGLIENSFFPRQSIHPSTKIRVTVCSQKDLMERLVYPRNMCLGERQHTCGRGLAHTPSNCPNASLAAAKKD